MTRRVSLPLTSDEVANQRISALVFALPVAVERRLGGHLYLGTGADGERRLLAALRAMAEGQSTRT